LLHTAKTVAAAGVCVTAYPLVGYSAGVDWLEMMKGLGAWGSGASIESPVLTFPDRVHLRSSHQKELDLLDGFAKLKHFINSDDVVGFGSGQALQVSQPFDSATNAITWSFAMTGGKEIPLRCETEVYLMVTEIQEVFEVFVLPTTPICEVLNVLDLWMVLSQVVGKEFHALVNKRRVMFHIV